MKNLDGRCFGKLMATNETRRRGLATERLCICQCGKKTWTTTTRLLTGHTKSCGCLRVDIRRLPSGVAARNEVLDNYKRGAAKRDLIWDITDSHFDYLTQQPCHYCGRLPRTVRDTKRGSGAFIYNGIDRRDNLLGYTIENCLSCCKICNGAKTDMTYEEFMSWIQDIAQEFNNGSKY